MKKTTTQFKFIPKLSLAMIIFAQLFTTSAIGQIPFWTENFGTGTCGVTQGQLASSYTGTHGAWAIGQSGTNDPESNVWFVSASEAGMGAGNCGSSCTINNQTLHIGANDGFSTTDAGASYNAGGLCGTLFCVATDKRAESPIINCTGHSQLSLSFNYLAGGDPGNDFGRVYYSIDAGITWNLLSTSTPTIVCASTAGQWAAFSMALPPTCNNNANVKIGFRWVNNDDATGSDPSFAIDDVTISATANVGVDELSALAMELTVSPNPFTQQTTLQFGYDFKNATVKLTDLLGKDLKTINFSGKQLIMEKGDIEAGTYFLRVSEGNVVINRKVVIQ